MDFIRLSFTRIESDVNRQALQFNLDHYFATCGDCKTSENKAGCLKHAKAIHLLRRNKERFRFEVA